ncbi:MAG: cupredoxin domain-containing protein [Candidatus Nitrosotenuis sp.]
MRYTVLLALFLIGAIPLIAQDASAQIAGNKAFSLTGNGFATSNDSIMDTNIDLAFITTKTKNVVGFDFQSGVITLNDKELTLSGFTGTTTNNGKIFRFTSNALDSSGEKFSVKTIGRLIDKTTTDSIYSLSITLTDSKKITTKLVYTTKTSEYVLKTQTAKTGATIKILKGSANPNALTLQDQLKSFRYFSEDRIMIKPGETITFVNEDTVFHSLKSGTGTSPAEKDQTFNADGKFASGKILPGKSWSATFTEPGFYRLFDENYQWMDITAFVFDTSNSKQIKSNKPLN